MAKPKVIKDEYSATVRIMGRVYESKGETISNAIAGLKPQNSKGKAILSVAHGEVKKDRILMPSIAFRLFNGSNLAREIALKQASTLFQGI